MDEVLLELEHATFLIVQGIEQSNFEDLESFVEERGQLLDFLQKDPDWSENKWLYEEKIMKLLAFDPIIMSRMQALMDEASHSLKKAEVGRAQRSAYEDTHVPESVFFDRKR